MHIYCLPLNILQHIFIFIILYFNPPTKCARHRPKSKNTNGMEKFWFTKKDTFFSLISFLVVNDGRWYHVKWLFMDRNINNTSHTHTYMMLSSSFATRAIFNIKRDDKAAAAKWETMMIKFNLINLLKTRLKAISTMSIIPSLSLSFNANVPHCFLAKLTEMDMKRMKSKWENYCETFQYQLNHELASFFYWNFIAHFSFMSDCPRVHCIAISLS